MSRRSVSSSVYGSAGSPSSTAMPIGNLAGGWTQIHAQDFLTNVAEGGFIPRTSGDLGMFDPASAGGLAYGNSGKGKAISDIPPGEPNTRYDSLNTLSVSNSLLKVRLQKWADGTIRAGAWKPIFGNGVDFLQPIKIRFRSRAYGANGFSYVFDWIGSNPDWEAGGGELGKPENGVTYPDAHIYYRGKTSARTVINGQDRPAYNVQGSDMGVNHQQFHIYEQTWIPSVSLFGTVDGVQVLADTNPATVWSTAKRWVMQSGGNPAVAVQGTEGFIEIDWISIWVQ